MLAPAKKLRVTRHFTWLKCHKTATKYTDNIDNHYYCKMM